MSSNGQITPLSDLGGPIPHNDATVHCSTEMSLGLKGHSHEKMYMFFSGSNQCKF